MTTLSDLNGTHPQQTVDEDLRAMGEQARKNSVQAFDRPSVSEELVSRAHDNADALQLFAGSKS